MVAGDVALVVVGDEDDDDDTFGWLLLLLLEDLECLPPPCNLCNRVLLRDDVNVTETDFFGEDDDLGDKDRSFLKLLPPPPDSEPSLLLLLPGESRFLNEPPRRHDL